MPTDVIARNNVKILGSGKQTIVFAHGFGCDQGMWRYLVPAFEKENRIVLFDQVGSGNSDISAYHDEKYATLSGYADDVTELISELDLSNVVFVGHSVAAMIGVLAASKAPERIASLVLVGPSARYINDGDYIGGFEREDIDSILDGLSANHFGWSNMMAPVIMGNQDRPYLGQELAESFCRTDPGIAEKFARVTFLGDNRADLSKISKPTLVMQCSQDVIAPETAGQFVRDAVSGSFYTKLEATGHCPHMSHPDEVIARMAEFLDRAA